MWMKTAIEFSVNGSETSKKSNEKRGFKYFIWSYFDVKEILRFVYNFNRFFLAFWFDSRRMQ